ncbi:MAG: glycoside hydrolase family 2 protein [Chthoniobacteraceae bacterium]
MNTVHAISDPQLLWTIVGTDCKRANVVEVSTGWTFALDPENAGKNLGWQESPPQSSTALDAGYPWEYWHPGYDGVAWYWKEISFDEMAPGGTKRLRFEAVSYWCECWLNGQCLGAHEGMYDEFVFDVTAYLRPNGKNLLTVRVINPPANKEIEGLRSGAPLNQSDLPIGKAAWYYNFGGIWGRVWVESLPKIHLTDLWVDPDWRTGNLTLRWTAMNTAEKEECNLTITVRERKSKKIFLKTRHTVLITQEQANGTCMLDCADLAEWSPTHPTLYRVEAALHSSHGLHSISQQVGIREFRLENGRFILNGSPVRLKGLLQQGAYPRRLGAPHSWRMGARELLTIKKAGFNFVRIHLKPAPAWYLDFADRLGILVMMEPPIGWIANSPKTEDRIRREVKALITANRSRACIVIWGIFNESFHLLGYGPGEMRRLAERIMNACREEDDSRLLIDTSGGYARASLQGAETMIHDTFRNVPSRYMQPRSSKAQEIVDVHIYCPMPPTPEIMANYSNINPGSLPLFLAEYGAAEMPPNFPKVLAAYSPQERQIGLEDWKLHDDFFRSLTHRFHQATLSTEFGGVEEWIKAVNHERARETASITLAARRNPHIAGFCHCQLADASGELFGVLDFWRRPKPILHALTRAIADPGAGFFPEKRWITLDDTLNTTLVIVSDAEKACTGQVEVEIASPDGSIHKIFSDTFCCETQIPFERNFTFCPTAAGIHEIRGRTMMRDGQTNEFSEKFGVLANETAPRIKVSGRFADRSCEHKIEECGLEIEAFGNNYRNKNIVLLLEWSAIAESVGSHCELLGQLRNIAQAGGVAIIFNPDTPMLRQWLLPSFIGVQPTFRTGVYLKKSPLFQDLPSGGVAGDLFASIIGDRWDKGDDITAAGGIIDVGAFSAHMWTRPAEYFWGAGLYRIPLGRGQIFICHLKLLDRLNTDPLAKKLFRNLLNYASSFIQPGCDELLFRRCIDPSCAKTQHQ